MRIAVFGSGGVGGYFGGRLAQAGQEVIFIARGEHLRAIQQHGLRVDSIQGDFVIDPAQASDDPAGIGPVDVILVGVKAWQVPQAAGAMRPMLGPATYLVPLQNGVEAPAQLAEVVGSSRVLGGLCKIVSFVERPGRIRHAGIDPYLAFGELDNRPSQRVERLRAACAQAAGLTVEVPADIRAAMWEKFLFIAALSGVGAVARAPAGVLRSLPHTRHLLEAAMQEVLAVARAHEIALADDIVDKTLAFVDSLAPDSTASMQRDIVAGRPSELASQNGAVARLGQAVGIATPVNDFIYRSLWPQELRARGELEF